MNFSKLDTLLAEYKESGLTTSEVLDKAGKLVEVLITPEGASPWKTMNALDCVQLGVLINMVEQYVQATY